MDQIFNTIKYGLLGVALIGSLSCSNDETSPVVFSIGTKKTYLIPAKTVTCQEQARLEVPGAELATINYGVGSKYFDFNFPKIGWTGSEDATVNIVGITVKIDSPNVNGKFQCIISSESLKHLFYKVSSSGVEYWDPFNITYDTATSQHKGSDYWLAQGYKSCPIRCGGVSTREGSFVATVVFEILLVATTPKEDGTTLDTPYKVSTTATVENLF